MKLPKQRNRRPYSLAKDRDRRRRARNPDKRIQDHRDWQTKRLANDLRSLRFRIARKVRNIQRQRGPITHHRRQRRKEEAKKAARRLETTRRRKHRPKSARLVQHPEQQDERHHKHERRRIALQKPDRFHTAPHHIHIQQPESKKTRPQNKWYVSCRRP